MLLLLLEHIRILFRVHPDRCAVVGVMDADLTVQITDIGGDRIAGFFFERPNHFLHPVIGIRVLTLQIAAHLDPDPGAYTAQVLHDPRKGPAAASQLSCLVIRRGIRTVQRDLDIADLRFLQKLYVFLV